MKRKISLILIITLLINFVNISYTFANPALGLAARYALGSLVKAGLKFKTVDAVKNLLDSVEFRSYSNKYFNIGGENGITIGSEKYLGINDFLNRDMPFVFGNFCGPLVRFSPTGVSGTSFTYDFPNNLALQFTGSLAGDKASVFKNGDLVYKGKTDFLWLFRDRCSLSMWGGSDYIYLYTIRDDGEDQLNLFTLDSFGEWSHEGLDTYRNSTVTYNINTNFVQNTFIRMPDNIQTADDFVDLTPEDILETPSTELPTDPAIEPPVDPPIDPPDEPTSILGWLLGAGALIFNGILNAVTSMKDTIGDIASGVTSGLSNFGASLLNGLKGLFIPVGFVASTFLNDWYAQVTNSLPTTKIDFTSFRSVELPDFKVNLIGNELVLVNTKFLRDNIELFRMWISGLIAVFLMIYNYRQLMKLFDGNPNNFVYHAGDSPRLGRSD